jgi:hypothetical protein
MSPRQAPILVAVLAILGLAGCQPYNSLAPQRQLPSAGFLQHRGRQYLVRDLLDPHYRAQSRDPFVENFDPEACFADARMHQPVSLPIAADVMAQRK